MAVREPPPGTCVVNFFRDQDLRVVPLLRYELAEAIKVTLEDVEVFRECYELALGKWRTCSPDEQPKRRGAPPAAAVYEYCSYLEEKVHPDGESVVFRPGLLVPRQMCEALGIAAVCEAPLSSHWSGQLSNLLVVPLLRHELAAAIKETVGLSTFKRCYVGLLGGKWPYGDQEDNRALDRVVGRPGPIERANSTEQEAADGYELWALRRQNQALKEENEALKAARAAAAEGQLAAGAVAGCSRGTLRRDSSEWSSSMKMTPIRMRWP